MANTNAALPGRRRFSLVSAILVILAVTAIYFIYRASHAAAPNPYTCGPGDKGAAHPVLLHSHITDANGNDALRSDQCVHYLQWDLKTALGYSSIAAVSGIYDSTTSDAVSSFQSSGRCAGCIASGDTDATTWLSIQNILAPLSPAPPPTATPPASKSPAPATTKSPAPTPTTPAKTLPSVEIKANNQITSAAVATDSSLTLTWTATNATSCTASGYSSWLGARGITGTESHNLDTKKAATNTYTLTCTGAGGSIAKSVTVYVKPFATTLFSIGSGGHLTQPLVSDSAGRRAAPWISVVIVGMAGWMVYLLWMLIKAFLPVTKIGKG